MLTFRNPTHLLGIDRDPALIRLLRACGVDEVYITGGAADYDKFCALAEALPLCAGHSLQGKVNRTLQEATGLNRPLCPHTAREIWEAWTDIYWYGREVMPRNDALACPYCGTCEPTCVDAERLLYLPDPAAVKADNFGAWTQNIAAALTFGAGHHAVVLPEDYSFVRPDPYHVGEVIRRISGGENPACQERDLLLTQALRVWGQTLLQAGTDGRLFLVGGGCTAVTALLDYLQKAKAMTGLVWIPRVPAAAGAVSGLYACVETGLDLTACSTPEAREAHTAAYAAVAPLGRAVVLWPSDK